MSSRVARVVFSAVLFAMVGEAAWAGASPAAVDSEPSDKEQHMIWLINRARSNPQAYEDEVIADAGINLAEPFEDGLLDGVAAQPPLALHKGLVTSARWHSEEMITNDYFDHYSAAEDIWPNSMIAATGYSLNAIFPANSNQVESIAAGSVWSNAPTPLAALIQDWDSGAGDYLDPPGHRIHLLATSAFFQGHREIGVGYAYNVSSDYRNYWTIHTAYTDTTDHFLTGVVYDDGNSNGRYDIGEGMGGVDVDAPGAGSTTTGAAGGWSIPAADAAYTVTCSGGSFTGTATANVTVAGENIEIDFIDGRTQGVVDFGTAPDADIAVSPSATGYRTGLSTFTLDGTGSTDAEGAIAGYAWSSSPSSGVTFTDDTADTTDVTFDNLGVHTITLLVTDLDGMTDAETVDIAVINKPPTVTSVTVTANPVDTLTAVTLDAAATDDDGTVDTYEWDTDGDGFDDGTGASAGFAGWPDDGTYTVRVRVTDDDGGATIDSVSVTVNNQPPVAASSGPGSPPIAAERGEVLTFSDAGSSDIDGTVVQWSWDFGDTWPTVMDNAGDVDHFWTSDNTYDVVLTVTDDDGDTHSAAAIQVIVSGITDTDGDGLPDSWETEHFGDATSGDAGEDAALDNDGLTVLEEFQNRTDPNAADSDGDGASDLDEVNGVAPWAATDPNNADTDGDGSSDGTEINRGYDPNDAGSTPPRRSSSSGGGGCTGGTGGTGGGFGSWAAAMLLLAAALAALRMKSSRVRARRE